MARTSKNWREVAEDKNLYQLAQFVLSDLTGYRATSLHRADDADTLTFLFKMLEDRAKEPKNDPLEVIHCLLHNEDITERCAVCPGRCVHKLVSP